MATSITTLSAIKRAPHGATLQDLLARDPSLSRRTLQRWISQWIEAKKIHATGKARSRRYFGAPPTVGAVVATSKEEHFPAYIPIAPASEDILRYLAKPLGARKPVGYSQEFLLAYEPNKTAYLPPALRRHLHRIGKTTDASAPAGTFSRAILNRLMIDLSWASSQLEGNTYSRLDTRALIEHGTVAIGKDAIETQMILNHKAAIEMLVENIGTAKFNRYTVMNLHSALAENLLPNADDEGRVRQHAVEISKSVFRPLSHPAQIEIALDNLLNKAERIRDPFEQSFFMLVHLPYLQPFADLNKRTSRLAANLPLMRANLCPLTFLGVPEVAYSQGVLSVYELTRVDLLRDVYAWSYQRSAQEYLAIKQERAEPDPLRLKYRVLIKEAVREIVASSPKKQGAILATVAQSITPKKDRDLVCALVADEVARLHEGVLARYGLKPSEFLIWKNRGG